MNIVTADGRPEHVTPTVAGALQAVSEQRFPGGGTTAPASGEPGAGRTPLRHLLRFCRNAAIAGMALFVALLLLGLGVGPPRPPR